MPVCAAGIGQTQQTRESHATALCWKLSFYDTSLGKDLDNLALMPPRFLMIAGDIKTIYFLMNNTNFNEMRQDKSFGGVGLFVGTYKSVC